MIPETSFGSEKLHCNLASNKKEKRTLNPMMSLATEELENKIIARAVYVNARYTEMHKPLDCTATQPCKCYNQRINKLEKVTSEIDEARDPHM